jgi:hypothetical protein
MLTRFHLHSDVRELASQIATTTFVTSGYQFRQESTDAVELIRYRIITAPELHPSDSATHGKSFLQDHAELILRPARDKLNSFSDQSTQQYVANSRSH